MNNIIDLIELVFYNTTTIVAVLDLPKLALW